MYTSFFGLNEKPFSITPDPRYLFLSEQHGEALAHLVYGVTESGGFIQLTGEVGTGKTTLVRTLLLNRMPDNADVAVVLNPQLSVLEFLATICEELHIDVPHNKGSIKALTDALNRHLLESARGRPTHHSGRRRSAESRARRARTGASADQPRNGQAETAADHPDRPARTA